mmetsp:Transcript_5620/g.16074  ORF Transcript_5620/g.16074 Transcript_5620/m.16074 type:complete len:196 (-) Transcript_5620:111-698(-)|eukprot:CAMPEP_0194506936 /NCGR_PEP_ID=MMETSP0253-20130528/35601_1 /TAXON_ID=2966 /ORGANISM="Noctiluca scintillans" /LENGTH=195 /DNA_ID=CAMNT_0039349733 /DNA_START=24 /DNA_END=611 /DNA_ORIENTATION=+
MDLDWPEQKGGRVPIFVQNPDGSLAKGTPPGFKESTPPSSPRGPEVQFPVVINADIVRALARHEIVFLGMLAMQFIVEMCFQALHIQCSGDAIFELSLIYPSWPVNWVYWTVSACEMVLILGSVGLGVMAVVKCKPWMYMRFSSMALLSTLSQLPLTYVNRFNLLVFFLRFISYAYARFFWNLLQSFAMGEGLTI